jgi:hypothetical protein
VYKGRKKEKRGGAAFWDAAKQKNRDASLEQKR